MSPGSCIAPVAASHQTYERIGWAQVKRASIEFALPILTPGGAVYLIRELARSSPLADVLAGKPVDLLDGTAAVAGRIYTSGKGTLLILAIRDAPAKACMIRQQFVKHVADHKDTPVLAFPNQAHRWGVRT